MCALSLPCAHVHAQTMCSCIQGSHACRQATLALQNKLDPEDPRPLILTLLLACRAS